MQTQRWLLPFTYGVDMQAIHAVLSVVESSDVTLVAVSLILSSPACAHRLELVQQSKDFLEAVKWQALGYKVEIERYEVFTPDVLRSLSVLARELDCTSVLLVSREGEWLLLNSDEVAHLITTLPISLAFISLPANSSQLALKSFWKRLISWWQRGQALPLDDPAPGDELAHQRLDSVEADCASAPALRSKRGS